MDTNMNSGSNSTVSSTPASILAFLEDRDDSRVFNLPAEGGRTSHPGSTTVSPSIGPSTAFTTYSSDSQARSAYSHSGSGSNAGLTYGASTSYGSAPSITTSQGANKLKNRLLVDASDDGTLTLPPLPAIKTYECPFDRLGCLETFNTPPPWYAHSLTHFKGQAPPNRAACCFCSAKFADTTTEAAWKMRMDHVKLHHDRGEQLATSRFDPELYRYLWSKKLVSDVDYKDLGGVIDTIPGTAPGVLPHAGVYTVANERRRFQRGALV